MLHRLMGRPVLPEADRVVREDKDSLNVRQGGKADRRAIVVRKCLECAAERYQAAKQRDAVHRRPHTMLADTVVDVSVLITAVLKVSRRIDVGIVRWLKVRRPSDQLRQGIGYGVDNVAAVCTGRFCLDPVKFWQALFPTYRQRSAADRTKSPAEVSMR